MTLSDNGMHILRNLEGYSPRMYKDIAGLPTIGVGHLLTKSELSSGKLDVDGKPWHPHLSDSRITLLLRHDILPAVTALEYNVKVPLNQNQFDALTLFVFNIGRSAFERSTLLKLLNAGDYAAVPSQLRRWVHAGGRVVKGLVNRREAEIALWNTPPQA